MALLVCLCVWQIPAHHFPAAVTTQHAQEARFVLKAHVCGRRLRVPPTRIAARVAHVYRTARVRGGDGGLFWLGVRRIFLGHVSALKAAQVLGLLGVPVSGLANKLLGRPKVVRKPDLG